MGNVLGDLVGAIALEEFKTGKYPYEIEIQHQVFAELIAHKKAPEYVYLEDDGRTTFVGIPLTRSTTIAERWELKYNG